MIAVVQRVRQAAVHVEEKEVGAIETGLLVLLGVGHKDTEADVTYLVDKITHLRIFEDENQKMNLSVRDVGGSLLVVSQFTLLGDCRKGRRPSFGNAARPETAIPLYELFVEKTKAEGISCETGQFQAMMDVSLVNQGPVTLILESRT